MTEELIIDVRKGNQRGCVTAEAFCQQSTGANLCRHGGRDEEPDEVISRLIDASQALGLSPTSYRVVREDLPEGPLVEYRYPHVHNTPSRTCLPGEECELCGHPLCGGECEEEDFGEVGEDCGCPYCPCMNETESGETCSQCLSGAHQG